MVTLYLTIFQVAAYCVEVNGTGSTIADPLIKVWSDTYTIRVPATKISYKGTSPADGIKQLASKKVDFSGIDMPLSVAELNKNEFVQFPLALGGVAPVVNLPGVYPGQFRLDGQTLGDIFLGKITTWNDPAIVALNPRVKLPEKNIIIVHRVSPPGVSTIIGNYLAKTNKEWKPIKGDGMAGIWPANSIEVQSPPENIKKIKETVYAIGYGPISHIMKNRLSYVQMKNHAGNYVSPSDENISSAAANAKWAESNSFDVVLTDQAGESSWPLTMASYALLHKISDHPERTQEILKYFKYSLRNGGLRAIENDYIPLPDNLNSIVRSSWKNIVDASGTPLYKE
jgi:phosphate transport system substrate-binding protein